jgi:hypothetical protein
MPKSLRLLLLLGLLAVIALPVSASSIIYSDRGTFQGALSSFFTDNYENPNYMFIQTDAQMTAVEGQTAYMSTGFSNLDIVFPDTGSNHSYCAGCNGSFILNFTNTSFGTSGGVFGVGFDIVDVNQGYFATVFLGNGTEEQYALPPPGSFWGITNPELINHICFGPANCGTTTSQSFALDNLTIGSPSGGTTPEPSTLITLGSGLLACAGFLRRKVKI